MRIKLWTVLMLACEEGLLAGRDENIINQDNIKLNLIQFKAQFNAVLALDNKYCDLFVKKLFIIMC